MNYDRAYVSNTDRRQRVSLKRNRFTLIELLVVIVIITILASMLLPALNGAKYAGKNGVSFSNLKQIGLATFDFEGDYSYMPYPEGGTTDAGSVVGTGKHFVAQWNGWGTTPDFDEDNDYANPDTYVRYFADELWEGKYLTDDQIFIDPITVPKFYDGAGLYGGGSQPIPGGAPSVSYHPNGYLTRSALRRFDNNYSTRYPGQTPLWRTGAGAYNHLRTSVARHPSESHWLMDQEQISNVSQTETGWPTTQGSRNRDTKVALMFDGHVETVARSLIIGPGSGLGLNPVNITTPGFKFRFWDVLHEDPLGGASFWDWDSNNY